MSLKFTSLSLISKLAIILSFLALFLWLIPNVVNYYENLNQFTSKKSSLQEVNLKHGITQNAQKFNEKEFNSLATTLFANVTVTSMAKGKYHITIGLEKEKIKIFNTFIETLALRYLVSIENNELQFEKKEKLLEASFIIEEF
jgi:hypothetical protein